MQRVELYVTKTKERDVGYLKASCYYGMYYACDDRGW